LAIVDFNGDPYVRESNPYNAIGEKWGRHTGEKGMYLFIDLLRQVRSTASKKL
jgi:hypothetical protein